MNLISLIIVLCGLIFAQAQEATVLRYDNQANAGDGSYQFSYETSDGIKREEVGVPENIPGDQEGPAIVMRGSFQYVGVDGNTYSVSYVADANGFQPEGAHLPKYSVVTTGQAKAAVPRPPQQQPVFKPVAPRPAQQQSAKAAVPRPPVFKSAPPRPVQRQSAIRPTVSTVRGFASVQKPSNEQLPPLQITPISALSVAGSLFKKS